MGDKDTVSVNVDLPADLHASFKSEAAVWRVTLKEAVIQAIRQWILDSTRLDMTGRDAT